jgi:hypothetical protein
MATETALGLAEPAFIAAAVSSVGAAVAAIVAAIQAFVAAESHKVTDRNSRAQILLEIADRWTEVLKVRYEIRKDLDRYKKLRETYAALSVREFTATDEWRNLRVLCNFYEFIGLITYHKLISLETMLVLVTVDRADYDLARPVVEWLRKEYRPDIYLFWDWVVEGAAKTSATNPFKGKRSSQL